MSIKCGTLLAYAVRRSSTSFELVGHSQVHVIHPRDGDFIAQHREVSLVISSIDRLDCRTVSSGNCACMVITYTEEVE